MSFQTMKMLILYWLSLLQAVHTTRMHNLSVAIFGQGWAHERLDKVDFLQNENR